MKIKKYQKIFMVLMAFLTGAYYFIQPKKSNPSESISLSLNQEQADRQLAMEPTSQPAKNSRSILSIINEENEVNFNTLTSEEKTEFSKLLREKGFSLKEESNDLEMTLVPSEEVQAANQSTDPNFALDSYSEDTYREFSQAILKEVNESETEIQLTLEDQNMIQEMNRIVPQSPANSPTQL